jgi:WD40 repeat protein
MVMRRKILRAFCGSLVLLVWGLCPARAVEGEDPPLAPRWVVREDEWPVRALAWRPDGGQLASGGWVDQIVRLWDPSSGRLVGQAVLPENQCLALSWTASGLQAVTADSVTGRAQVWNVATEETVAPLEHFSGLQVSWNPDVHRLVGDGYLYGGLWDTATGKLLRDSFERDLAGAAFSPDGQHLALVSSMGGVRLTETETGRELQVLRDPSEIPFGITGTYGRGGGPGGWSPDGRYVAACTSRTPMPRDEVRVWDAATGAVVASSPQGEATPADVLALAWSADSRSIAYSRVFEYEPFVREVWLWEPATGKRRLLTTEENVVSLAFSPDGKWLAGGGGHGSVGRGQGNVTVWELRP